MFNLADYLRELTEEELRALKDFLEHAESEDISASIIDAELADEINYEHFLVLVENELAERWSS